MDSNSIKFGKILLAHREDINSRQVFPLKIKYIFELIYNRQKDLTLAVLTYGGLRQSKTFSGWVFLQVYEKIKGIFKLAYSDENVYYGDDLQFELIADKNSYRWKNVLPMGWNSMSTSYGIGSDFNRPNFTSDKPNTTYYMAKLQPTDAMQNYYDSVTYLLTDVMKLSFEKNIDEDMMLKKLNNKKITHSIII